MLQEDKVLDSQKGQQDNQRGEGEKLDLVFSKIVNRKTLRGCENYYLLLCAFRGEKTAACL